MRYHHDGKYNVMSIVGPVEIYGTFYKSAPCSVLNSACSRQTLDGRLRVRPELLTAHRAAVPRLGPLPYAAIV
jgi:hypothetical protein